MENIYITKYFGQLPVYFADYILVRSRTIKTIPLMEKVKIEFSVTKFCLSFY